MRTRAGYAGGSTPAPTYTAMGDHTECLQVDFDPEVTSFEALLAHFWRAHSPWRRTPGRQYRSVLLVSGPAQRAAAEQSRAALQAEEGREVFTPIEDLGAFTRAEDYHQKYALRRHREVAADLLAIYGEGDGFTDSTAATRLNSWLGGHAPAEQVARESKDLGLSARALAEVQRRVARTSGRAR